MIMLQSAMAVIMDQGEGRIKADFITRPGQSPAEIGILEIEKILLTHKPHVSEKGTRGKDCCPLDPEHPALYRFHCRRFNGWVGRSFMPNGMRACKPGIVDEPTQSLNLFRLIVVEESGTAEPSIGLLYHPTDESRKGAWGYHRIIVEEPDVGKIVPGNSVDRIRTERLTVYAATLCQSD